MKIGAVDALRARIDGEVRIDRMARLLVSTDASLYEIVPDGVVFPRHERDCERIVQWAKEHSVALTPRGAGTSLAGQAIGSGWVVDCSRHMREIVSIDANSRHAVVQPGVIIEELNRAAAPLGMMFAPDPSTLNRCNVGGAIGNNAWGAHALRYGTTRDHVEKIALVAGDGISVYLGATKAPLNSNNMNSADPELRLRNAVIGQIDTYREDILKRYPPPGVPCNNGYALHRLARGQPWDAQGAPFNLSNLLCGAEGTLGLVTQATVRLEAIPSNRFLIAGHFDSVDAACAAVTIAVNAGASAVELLDEFVLGLVADNHHARQYAGWIRDGAKAILLAEFTADSMDACREPAEQVSRQWLNSQQCFYIASLAQSETAAAWAIRRAGLGLLMGMVGSQKPVTFIEDSAVAVADLVSMVAGVRAIMTRHDVPCVYYGSVGMGLVHLRPLLDLTKPDAGKKISEIANDVFNVLQGLGGTASAKHGDGRVRGATVRRFLGDQVYTAMKNIKNQFDPDGLFNPGIMFDPEPMTQNWRRRLVPTGTDHGNDKGTFFRWSAPGGVVAAAQRCLGAGVCRRRDGPGTMCPSYRVTLEEQHSTRGRGNVLRQVMASEGFAQAMTHPLVHDAMKLCLGCKGCRSECPANVDMARLKSEHLAHYYRRHGAPMRIKLLTQIENINRIAARMPSVANKMFATQWAKRFTGVHPARTLPGFAPQSLSRWFSNTWRARHPQRERLHRGDIWVYNDTFSEFYDVEVGKAAVVFFDACGYHVRLTPQFPSLRIALSLGFVDLARARLLRVVDWFLKQSPQIVVGLEPSETLSFRDEAPALYGDNEKGRQAGAALRALRLFDEVVAQALAGSGLGTSRNEGERVSVLLHGHCHQKALTDMSAARDALSHVGGATVKLLETGCCGMAGFFGYEKDNYEVSMAIGEQVLFPAVRAAAESEIIVASGTSCRQQILHGTGRVALHPAQVLANRFKLKG